MGLDVLILVWS